MTRRGPEETDESRSGEDVTARGYSLRWTIAFTGLAFLLRLPFVGLPFGQQDEGYYAAVARATAQGARLYADMAYVRPPALNFVYEVAYRASGVLGLPYDLTLRLEAALFAALAVGALAGFLHRRLDALPAAAGSLLAAILSASLILENEANAETWLLLPYTLSALLLYRALERPMAARQRWLMIFVSGGLLALAAAFKEVALVGLALPLVASLAWRRGRAESWLGPLALFGAGALAVGAALLGYFAVIGEAPDFIYNTWLTRLLYVVGSHSRVSAVTMLFGQLQRLAGIIVAPTAAAFLTYGTVLIADRGERPRERRLAAFALGWLVLSALGVAAAGRFYAHYFIQTCMPLAMLLAASAAIVSRRNCSTQVRGVLATVIVLFGLVLPMGTWVKDLQVAPIVRAGRAEWRSVAERVEELTPEGGTFLVWGTFVSVRAYADVPSATNVAWVYYAFGPAGSQEAIGRTFASTGDRVLDDIRWTPPDTIVVSAELGDYLPGFGVNELDPPDDVRVRETLESMIASEFEEAARGDAYVILTRVPSRENGE